VTAISVISSLSDQADVLLLVLIRRLSWSCKALLATAGVDFNGNVMILVLKKSLK